MFFFRNKAYFALDVTFIKVIVYCLLFCKRSKSFATHVFTRVPFVLARPIVFVASHCVCRVPLCLSRLGRIKSHYSIFTPVRGFARAVSTAIQ